MSYIPWSKIKPDIDLELLEDGGMIDEDTMPDWLKVKAAELNKTGGSKSALDIKNIPGATPIDTSQPPPVPGAGLMQPPLTLPPMVNPFQLNNGLLSVGMNIPPGIMPNVPIGVPPPNLPAPPMMNNPLLGISSPFGQAPPGLLQMTLSGHPGSDKGDVKMSVNEQILGMQAGFGMGGIPQVCDFFIFLPKM